MNKGIIGLFGVGTAGIAGLMVAQSDQTASPPPPRPELPRVAPQYPITFVANPVIGDGSTPNGGTAPAEAQMPPPFPETTDPTTAFRGGPLYRPVIDDGRDEAKVRFTCIFANVGVFDSIRYRGQAGAGHRHTFFGSPFASPTSDFTELRQKATDAAAQGQSASTCAGDHVNGSLYWVSSVEKPNVFAPGKKLAKKVDTVTLYYFNNKPGDSPYTQWFRRGFEAIIGMDMDFPNGDPEYLAAVKAWNDANPGNPLNMPAPKQGSWTCAGGSVNGSYEKSPKLGDAYQPSLTNYDGSPTLICPADKPISNAIHSDACWNGNLRGPGGYRHLQPMVFFRNTGWGVCPWNWYRLPTISVQFNYSHGGPADYSNWSCSSDPMGSIAAGRPMRACETTHTDYVFAWRESVSDEWQVKCIGLSIPGRGTPQTADCNFDTINSTTALRRTFSAERKFKGDRVSDWFIPVENVVSGNMHGGRAHGGR